MAAAAPPAFYDRALDLFRWTTFDCRLDRIAVMSVEHAFHRGAVVGVVGVQPDPAVGGAVVPRDRVPQRRLLPADRTEQPLGSEAGAGGHAVDRDRRHFRLAPGGE
jgi:hypothetical protein